MIVAGEKEHTVAEQVIAQRIERYDAVIVQQWEVGRYRIDIVVRDGAEMYLQKEGECG